eukprot:jgi/Mesvir1/1116/Mv17622-RA.1
MTILSYCQSTSHGTATMQVLKAPASHRVVVCRNPSFTHKEVDYFAELASEATNEELPIAPEGKGKDAVTMPWPQMRPLQTGDECPICYDDISEQQDELTWCMAGCGRACHALCQRRWAQKRRSAHQDVNCVVCRAVWCDPPAYEKAQFAASSSKD